MPEVIFNGPDGRLEGRYHHAPGPNAPIAILLHPHPLQGGTMNSRVVFETFQVFMRRGFSTLRFNFRGVGRSQGTYDEGLGELSDAAAAPASNIALPPCALCTTESAAAGAFCTGGAGGGGGVAVGGGGCCCQWGGGGCCCQWLLPPKKKHKRSFYFLCFLLAPKLG